MRQLSVHADPRTHTWSAFRLEATCFPGSRRTQGEASIQQGTSRQSGQPPTSVFVCAFQSVHATERRSEVAAQPRKGETQTATVCRLARTRLRVRPVLPSVVWRRDARQNATLDHWAGSLKTARNSQAIRPSSGFTSKAASAYARTPPGGLVPAGWDLTSNCSDGVRLGLPAWATIHLRESSLPVTPSPRQGKERVSSR